MRLSEIAERIGCEMQSSEDVEIQRVAGIQEAGPGDLTFVSNPKYVRHIATTRASAIILSKEAPALPIPSLRTTNPYLAFALALDLFFEPERLEPGIHPTAAIGEDVEIGEGCRIGAYVVVGRGCRIGARVTLHPHVVIYPGVEIGEGSELHSGAVVRERCALGKRVILQNGAVVGSDGFGFAPRSDGSYRKISQTGRVLLGDDVEIGANTTVDRAAVGDSVVRRGAKLDNLVQIGHGSVVGEDTVVAAQVGVAGSTIIGSSVKLGGQVGLAGHMEVGDGAVVYAQSGASHDIPAGATVSGSPAFDGRDWLRAVTAFERLPDLFRRVRQLEREFRRKGSADAAS